MRSEIIYKKVGANFQITLPQKYCQQLKIEPGTILKVNKEAEKLVIEPALDNKNETLIRLQNIFKELDAKTPFSNNEEEIIKEVADEIKSSRVKP